MTGGFGFFAPRLDGFLTAEQMNRQPARLCTVQVLGGAREWQTSLSWRP
jgi:hypothetical protein